MKGIETGFALLQLFLELRSDHCPAMKGIETNNALATRPEHDAQGSDHCPAMKGIETSESNKRTTQRPYEATTAPQ